MPITNSAEAKEGGFAQVREALVAFEGDVVEQDARGSKTEFATWGGTAINPDTGLPFPPKEYLQVVCTNVVVTESVEAVTMDISEGWTFRVNCSDFKGSFWIDAFLASADKFKVQIPAGLIGKRIGFRKVVLEAKPKKDGTVNHKFDATGFVITSVATKGSVSPKVTPKVVETTPSAHSLPPMSTAPAATTPPTTAAEGMVDTTSAPSTDPMVVALELAVGKTEQQFRSAVALHPLFVNSPLLAIAKSGAITQTLVNDHKLQLVVEGNKSVYRKV